MTANERRFELPDAVESQDERAILAALERFLEERDPRPSAWAVAGRIEACRDGALQARRLLRDRWRAASREAFARTGTEPIRGRGDAA